MSDNTQEPVMSTNSLKKYYPHSDSIVKRILGNTSYIKAVDNVNINIKKGESYGLVGESGSGKSTLGELLLKLQDPTDGELIFNGKKLSDYSSKEIREFRKNVQIILQDPYDALNPRQTVFQIVSEPLRNFFDYSDKKIESMVSDILTDVGLRPADEFLYKHPEQLSGGERQRVNIARAIILKPDVLVADEPLSMLDVSVQGGIIKLLDDLKEEYNYSLLYISHNLAVVKLISDRIGVMYKGRIVEEGEADEIINSPKHPYSRALIQSIPRLNEERERVLLPEHQMEEHEEVSGCRFHPRCPDKMDICTEHTPAMEDVDGVKVACYLHHSEHQEERSNES